MISARTYVSDDYNAVKELYTVPGFGGQFDPDRDSQEKLDSQSAKDPQSILVAEDGSRIVGTVSILADKRFAWLMRFAVSDPRAVDVLLEKAYGILRGQGHSQVLVYAPSNDSSFKIFYQDCGFEEGLQSYDVFWRSLD